MNIYTVLFGIALISGSLSAQIPSNNTRPTALNYYLTHIIVDGLLQCAIVPTTLAAGGIGGAVGLCIDPKLQGPGVVIAAISTLAGFALGLKIFYRAPEWTDEVVLNIHKKRSAAQNILSCLGRIFLAWPLGNLVTEVIIREDQN